MLARLVPIEAPNCNRRLDFRSWKNVFQSRTSPGLDDAFDVVRADVDGESGAVFVDDGAAEAYLTSCLEGVTKGEGVLIALLEW